MYFLLNVSGSIFGSCDFENKYLNIFRILPTTIASCDIFKKMIPFLKNNQNHSKAVEHVNKSHTDLEV